MNILVYSHVPTWEQHHSESIEIANRSLENGNNVFFLSCDSSLKNCPANYFKDKNYCNKCLKQTNYTNNIILSKKINKIYLNTEPEPISIKINSLDDLYNFKYDDVNLGLPVLSTIITDQYRDCYLNIKKIKNQAVDYLQNTVGLYLKSKEIIRNYSIDEVYVWNGRRMSDAPIILAAKKMKKKYYTFMSGGQTSKFLCQNSSTVHDLNYSKNLIKSFYNKHGKKNHFKIEARKFFSFMRYGKLSNQDKIYAYGYIPFNKFFKKKEIFNKKDIRKKMVIFTSSLWEYISLGDDFFKKNGKKINHYDLITKILSDKTINKNYEICTRWHPFLREVGENEKKIINHIISKFKKVIHIKPNDDINSYEILENSDVVLTFGSTLGVEACYYGKPSILMGRSYYEDTGSVYKPINLNELIRLLKIKKLKPKDPTNAYKYGFFDRHRGTVKFKYVKVDKNLRYYFDNKRIKYMDLKTKVMENLVFILESLNIKILLKKIIYRFSNIFNKKKSFFLDMYE